MPPEEQKVNINISPTQFIGWMASMGSTIIGVALYMIFTFAPAKDVEGLTAKQASILAEGTERANLLIILKRDLEDTKSSLENKIAETDKQQLTLRRDVLLSDKNNLSEREKTELRKIEEIMINQGYLNPSLITNVDQLP